jgi:hypothetical protein
MGLMDVRRLLLAGKTEEALDFVLEMEKEEMGLSTVIEVVFLALCLWREARGETIETKYAVAHVVKNRVDCKWGKQDNFQDVVTAPWQFSGMTATNDPNTSKFPKKGEKSWEDCIHVAKSIVGMRNSYTHRIDPTGGAVFYHDISIPAPPKAWGNVVESFRSGRIRFYKMRKSCSSK